MPKVYPVGTVREWEHKGKVIKAHDGTKLHNGWIALESPDHLKNITKECDVLANMFRSMKTPIDGEVYLDHELKEYKREAGEDCGPYSPDQFKQYEGSFGAGRYSFFNEFAKRFMAKKIQAQSHYHDLLN